MKKNNIFAIVMSAALVASSAVAVSAFAAEGEEAAPAEEISITAENPEEAAVTTTAEEAAVTTTAEETSTTEAVTTTAEEVTTEAVTSTEKKTYTSEDFIATGTWYATGNFEGYKTYTFDADQPAGGYIISTEGIGAPFAYDLNGNDIVFHFFVATDNSPATLVRNADGTFVINFASGGSETFSQVKPAEETASTTTKAAVTTAKKTTAKAATTKAATTKAAATTAKKGSSPKTGDTFPVVPVVSAIAAASAVAVAFRKKND